MFMIDTDRQGLNGEKCLIEKFQSPGIGSVFRTRRSGSSDRSRKRVSIPWNRVCVSDLNSIDNSNNDQSICFNPLESGLCFGQML